MCLNVSPCLSPIHNLSIEPYRYDITINCSIYIIITQQSPDILTHISHHEFITPIHFDFEHKNSIIHVTFEDH